MAGAPTIPTSLVPGATAAARRLLADVAAPNAAPTLETEGAPTNFALYLSLVIELGGTPGVVTYRVWYWIRSAGRWVVDTRPATATAGVVTFDPFSEPNPQLNLTENPGWERIYIQLITVAPACTVDAWAEGVTYG